MIRIPFDRWMVPLLLVSVVAVAGSLYLIGTKGFNLGTDFKGGIQLDLSFPEKVSEGEVRRILEPIDLGNFSVKKIGEADENRIVVSAERQSDLESLGPKMVSALASGLKMNGIVVEREESVGPKAGKDLKRKAQLAIIVSWLLMLIYVGFRFDFNFAPGAILALIHDVLVTLGAFVISGREVSLTIVAALLTIVGYSINDTIVIYDRVRENLPKMPKTPLPEVLNISLNQTLSRTLITSLTVFMVVLPMYLFGEGEFQNFGFAMTIGVVVGCYSTIAIASPCYLFLKKIRKRTP